MFDELEKKTKSIEEPTLKDLYQLIKKTNEVIEPLIADIAQKNAWSSASLKFGIKEDLKKFVADPIISAIQNAVDIAVENRIDG